MRLLNKPVSPRAIGITAAVVTVLIWTSFIVVTRATADPSHAGALHPLDLVLARLLGAGTVLIPLGWWLVRRDLAAGRPRSSTSFFGFSPLPWRQTVLAGIFGGLFYAGFAYSGFMFAPASHASVLLPGSLPLWTTLFAALVLGTLVSGARAIGLAFIVGGGLLVGGRSLLHAFDGGHVWVGDLLFMGASASWAIYGVMVRKFAFDAARATAAITVFAVLVYLPLYVVLVALGVIPGRLFEAPLREVLFQMVFQGVGSVVISGMTFTRMVQHFGPVRSTMITSVVPGLSALGAVMFLGEPLYWNLLLGLGFVTLGIVFGVRLSAAASVPVAPVSRGSNA